MGGKDIKQTWYSWGRSTNGVVTVKVSNSLPNISVKSRQASIIVARKLKLGQSFTLFSVSTTFCGRGTTLDSVCYNLYSMVAVFSYHNICISPLYLLFINFIKMEIKLKRVALLITYLPPANSTILHSLPILCNWQNTSSIFTNPFNAHPTNLS